MPRTRKSPSCLSGRQAAITLSDFRSGIGKCFIPSYAIKKITTSAFRQYGWVIEYPNKGAQPKNKSLFRIIVKERAKTGWRIACLLLREKAIDKLEQHPDSLESFEPVSGKTIICLTSVKDINKIESFYLDKPVILKKGVWHGVITAGSESEIKITENAAVKCVYWRL